MVARTSARALFLSLTSYILLPTWMIDDATLQRSLSDSAFSVSVLCVVCFISLSLSLATIVLFYYFLCSLFCCLQITVAGVDRVVSGVKLPIVGVLGVGVGRRRSLWLVQGVAAFVLFPHPVHDEHDDEDGTEQADYRAADHSCENAGLREEARGSVLILGVHDQHSAAAVRVVAVVAAGAAVASSSLDDVRRRVQQSRELVIAVRRVLYAGARRRRRRLAVLATG